MCEIVVMKPVAHPPAIGMQTAPAAIDDWCGAGHALEMVGNRWALLVMRELMLGPQRFRDLRANLISISPNILTTRLAELEQIGAVVRCRLPSPASVQVYGLTEWGHASASILAALGRWAAQSPRHKSTIPFSPVSLLLSFSTMFDPAKAEGLNCRIGFRMKDDILVARIDAGSIEVTRTGPEGCDAVVSGNPSDIASFIYAGLPLAELEAAGRLEVDGDSIMVERFAAVFADPAHFDIIQEGVS